MKNKFTKKLALLLAVVIVITTSAIGFMAYGATQLCAINPLIFPDDNFRTIILKEYDENGDRYLSDEEVKDVSTMQLSFLAEDYFGEGAKIKDLTGIEYFSNLKRLRASGLGIENLNVTRLPNLVELTIQGNELSSIDLMNNAKLETLNVSSNNLTSLNLTNNSKLQKVYANENKISSVVFNSSVGETLTEFYIYRNELTSLDVSPFVNLTWFNCSRNHLTALDLSKNTKLLNVTDAFIGGQEVEAEARIDYGNILVEFAVPNYNTNLVSSSVDKTFTTEDGGTWTTSGYDGVDFTPEDCDEIVNGITYYYNTGLADAESMDVHINVKRDFWQVKYFTDESKTTLFKKEIVYTGKSATAPADTGAPQCKLFVEWSETANNVTKDMDIYAVWKDDHNIVVNKYEGGLFFFDCTKCNDQKSDYSFVDYVNIRRSHEMFPALLDQNNDGVINAKDYAILIKALK